MPRNSKSGIVISLDIGDSRIGVARGSWEARLASPLTFLPNNQSFLNDLTQLIAAEKAESIVVGLPRSLDGQDTPQTAKVRDLAETIRRAVNLPIYFQDEALTSQLAEAELAKGNKTFTKGDIDALAATYILQDYFNE